MNSALGGANFDHGDVRREEAYLHANHVARHDALFWEELRDTDELIAAAEGAQNGRAVAAARARFAHFCRLHRVLSLRLGGRNRTDGVSRFTNGPVIEPLALGAADGAGAEGDGDGAPPPPPRAALMVVVRWCGQRVGITRAR